ncbi:MAG: 2-oxo acid dehydrogenase subunit E2 [Chloroflexi bacterium]|nr:2-oxo acid dehydrogenase subunit E2 [Chloroflexota bacterium]
MATKFLMPKLGQTMEEGTVVDWLKKEGDTVSRGEEICEIESDKAVLPAESTAKGVLLKILVPKGGKALVLEPIAIIGASGEDISALLAESGAAPAAAVTTPETPASTQAPLEMAAEVVEVAAPQAPGGRLFVSPRARKLAEERQVNLALVKGTGPEGRIIEKDVQGYLASQPAATPLARKEAAELNIPLTSVAQPGIRVTAEQVRGAIVTAPPTPAASAPIVPQPAAVGSLTPMKGVRAIIAQRMLASSQTTASVTLFTTVDATEFVAAREKLKDAFAKELGFNIGFNDLLAFIVARCLSEFSYMNVRLEEGGIRQLADVNVGMAVDTERGLLVPVLRNANLKSVKQLAIEFRALVERARVGKSLPDDISGGTFTITNLGMYGVDEFTPIINLPEIAILGVGRIRQEPAVVNGQVAVRQMLRLSLTFDHRIVDGAPAARFLQGISKYVESPYLLLA